MFTTVAEGAGRCASRLLTLETKRKMANTQQTGSFLLRSWQQQPGHDKNQQQRLTRNFHGITAAPFSTPQREKCAAY